MLKKLGLVFLAVTIPVLYITSGQLNSSVADLGKILVNLFHPTFELDSIVERVILLIRIPRALTAMIC
ncbi:MAG: iron ABC transporter permease, partial [bacterium]